MPKVKYIKPRRTIRADYVMETLQRYMTISSDDLGQKIGMTGSSVRHKRSRGSEGFTLKELRLWADALKIPPEELAKAIQMYLE